MAAFHIDVPVLSRGLLDRSEDVREPAAVAAAWPGARVLQVGEAGRLPLAPDAGEPRLAFADAARFGVAPPAGAVLLGSIAGTHYWAVPAVVESAGTIRSVGPLLSDDEAALATTAVALLGWHATAAYCSRCGRPTAPDATGHSRSCPVGHQEFPRTDPAVIVLVHDGEGNAVLARQPGWAPGRFSVLAGFAEAGESLEATVVREIGEEVGVAVRDVEYLGSQPWPFPRSLMIAFAARAPRGAALRPRPGEIEQARWFSRDRLRGIISGNAEEGITLPDPVSIARRMVEGFVAAP
jgi:NAD+ diphosphatase